MSEQDGPAGYTHYADPYEDHSGPFWFRVAAEGGVETLLRPKPEIMNMLGSTHGGALMTFADFTLCAAGFAEETPEAVVTVSFSCEFVAAGRDEGDITGRAECVRRTRSLMFIRGELEQHGRVLLTFSGVGKPVGPVGDHAG
jgi:uncharacterized protein (TIGR00369 family)